MSIYARRWAFLALAALGLTAWWVTPGTPALIFAAPLLIDLALYVTRKTI